MNTEERRRATTLPERLRVALPLLAVWAVGLAVMVGVALQSDERAAQLLLDPGRHWYSGLVSNLGILAWTVAVTAGVAGAWICGLGGRRSAQRFLVTGALVSALLLVEDLFQLHSTVVPDLTGLPKGVVAGISGLVALRWVSQYREEVRRTHGFLLAAALAALALSIVVDLLVDPRPGEFAQVIEDGAKLFGVLAWSAYFVVTARDINRSVFTEALLTWPDEAYDAAFGPGAYAADVELLPELELDEDPGRSVIERSAGNPSSVDLSPPNAGG